jgi:hypothetical protein
MIFKMLCVTYYITKSDTLKKLGIETTINDIIQWNKFIHF